MFSRTMIRPKAKAEGEKPFWISYADLMTALMVMFLVTMAVTVLALETKLNEAVSKPQQRDAEIRDICEAIKDGMAALKQVNVNCEDNRIDFGEGGRFDYKEYRLRPEADAILRQLIPVILRVAQDPRGERWLKQVIIEGHTDTTGGYLSNLHLSLERSYWVMCMLADPRKNAAMQLSDSQVQTVRNLFLAGGVSFNDAKASDDASRRVEFRMQFYTLAERESGATRPAHFAQDTGGCALQ